MGRSNPLRPANYIRWASVNKGLLGSDRLWRTVFIVMTGRKVLRKVMGSEPETVAIERLKPGQFVSIAAIDPETLEPKSKRRRARGRVRSARASE